MMTWQPSIGQLVSARIVTRGLFWLGSINVVEERVKQRHKA